MRKGTFFLMKRRGGYQVNGDYIYDSEYNLKAKVEYILIIQEGEEGTHLGYYVLSTDDNNLFTVSFEYKGSNFDALKKAKGEEIFDIYSRLGDPIYNHSTLRELCWNACWEARDLLEMSNPLYSLWYSAPKEGGVRESLKNALNTVRARYVKLFDQSAAK